jgi:nitrite reductase/ring-hydroxylating ferredoxin subunit
MLSAGVGSATGPARWRPGFSEYLLGGIVVLLLVGTLGILFLYLVPPEPLQLAELQPAYRVAVENDIPANSSRLIDWGEDVILVVRSSDQAFYAVQGTAPSDGCILQWNPTALRIESPCTHLVYDLRGNVVRGLTTVPLQRYPVFIRDSVVYVAKP